MRIIELNDKKYEVIKDYRDALNIDELKDKFTDYFYDYDYVLGDIAYGKLRLKGFYSEKNKKVNKINNYNNIDKYIEQNCANDCKHFIIKKN